MLSKNSSRVTVASDPDHFGITEISDRSLWTFGVVAGVTMSLRRCISFSLIAFEPEVLRHLFYRVKAKSKLKF